MQGNHVYHHRAVELNGAESLLLKLKKSKMSEHGHLHNSSTLNRFRNEAVVSRHADWLYDKVAMFGAS